MITLKVAGCFAKCVFVFVFLVFCFLFFLFVFFYPLWFEVLCKLILLHVFNPLNYHFLNSHLISEKVILIYKQISWEIEPNIALSRMNADVRSSKKSYPFTIVILPCCCCKIKREYMHIVDPRYSLWMEPLNKPAVDMSG